MTEELSAMKKGIRLSEEHRNHISQGNQGKVLTTEHCLAISQGRLGMKFSDDHKEALSAARKSARYRCNCRVCNEEFLSGSPAGKTCNKCKEMNRND